MLTGYLCFQFCELPIISLNFSIASSFFFLLIYRNCSYNLDFNPCRIQAIFSNPTWKPNYNGSNTPKSFFSCDYKDGSMVVGTLSSHECHQGSSLLASCSTIPNKEPQFLRCKTAAIALDIISRQEGKKRKKRNQTPYSGSNAFPEILSSHLVAHSWWPLKDIKWVSHF